MPVNRELTVKEQDLNLKYGVVTINEVRAAQGLAPVPWGDAPWLPRLWVQTNDPNRADRRRNDSHFTAENAESVEDETGSRRAVPSILVFVFLCVLRVLRGEIFIFRTHEVKS